MNPLYEVSTGEGMVRLRLRFPSTDYADEYQACREYLPDEMTIHPQALERLERYGDASGMDELVARRIIVDLPEQYY